MAKTAEEEETAYKVETHQQLFKILETVQKLSNDSHNSDSSAIKALLELRPSSTSILYVKSDQLSISQHLTQLINLIQEHHNSKPPTHGVVSFLTRRVRSHQVSKLASKLESEIHTLIDREIVSILTKTISQLRTSSPFSSENKLLDYMSVLQTRLSRSFDIDFQHVLLKSRIFEGLEWCLTNPLFTKNVREKAAISIKELMLYNKDVFVGYVLNGGVVKALVIMNTSCSLQVLSTLIKAIRSPLVDEIESYGGILRIVGCLSSEDMEMRMRAISCVMEIGYYGRKEAVEVMINGGLISELVELQRLGFERCVARFGVQLQVGEGLRNREKRAYKQLILCKVREACVGDAAQSATIVAQVLWGSSP